MTSAYPTYSQRPTFKHHHIEIGVQHINWGGGIIIQSITWVQPFSDLVICQTSFFSTKVGMKLTPAGLFREFREMVLEKCWPVPGTAKHPMHRS